MSNAFPSSPPRVVEGITLKFPAKLWRIVNGCLSGAVSWSMDGTAIKINKRQFEKEYLHCKKYFKTVNFPSFIRQLNIYGFRKQTGSGQWYEKIGVFEYKHRYFQKGRPELLSHVTRNVIARKERECDKLGRLETKYKGKVTSGVHRPTTTDHGVYEHTSQRTGMLFHQLLRASDLARIRPDTADMPAGEMSMISPRRLHDQMAVVLSGVDPVDTSGLDQSESSYGDDRESGNSSTDEILEIEGSTPQKSETIMNTNPSPYELTNPVVFLPRLPDMDNLYMDKKLSELNVDLLCDSSDNSQTNKELMFSSAVEKETDDLAANLDDVLSNEGHLTRPGHTGDWMYPGVYAGVGHGSPQLYRAMYSTDELAVCPALAETYRGAMEDAVFTPAYFDPATGTVTLLLPTSTDDGDNCYI